MIVISDASPLITLAPVGCLEHLPNLFGRIAISQEVYQEVVVKGAGLPGANHVSAAQWIDVTAARNAEWISEPGKTTSLGAGELSTVALAIELSADLVLIDERRARYLAASKGLNLMGCVRILEILFEREAVTNLRDIYRELLIQKIHIDLRTLQLSLAKFNLPQLRVP